MAVKKTQMYRRNLDGTETNLNPLTESQYVLMENGQTVQEVLSDRDSDKYTPVITNSSSTFKVGQGDNVDLSSSMKEGAYDSCVLKGKTLVNCIQEPSSQDVVLPYEFADGQYVTINDTKESGALGVELKGQTLVNLQQKGSYWNINGTEDNPNSNASYRSDEGFPLSKLKPNTKYLVKFSRDISAKYGSFFFVQGTQTTWAMQSGGWGIVTTKSELTSSTTGIHVYPRENNGVTAESLQDVHPMIIEYQEGMENWDIPYFEGMTSCKMPILHTVGKNLFDLSRMKETGSGTGHTINLSNNSLTTSDNNAYVTGKGYIITGLKKNTPYRLTVTNDSSSEGTANFNVCSRDGSVWYEQRLYDIPIGSTQSRIIYTDTGSLKVSANAHTPVGCTVTLKDIQIEEVASENVPSTSYEPYKSSILSLPEEVVLRSLPNGVCDTFNTRTGEYVQRIGEHICKGDPSEVWKRSSNSNSKTLTSHFNLTSVPNPKSISSHCNALPYADRPLVEVETESYKISGQIWLNVLKTKLETDSNDGLKKYLKTLYDQGNPITIQYELATPIVTKINLSSTLKSWNTTTHIYSEIPENTLYPILSHSNPSYPVILKPSTRYSIVANSYSNSHTNSAINFNLGGATTSTTVGKRVTTITTPSTLSNELLTMSGRGNKLNHVMVIEGDVVGDEPYFEGICDCKSPILSNVGKNLFTTNNMRTGNIAGNGSSIEGNDISGNWQVTDYIPVKPLIKYYHSTSLYKFEKVSFYDINKKIIYGTGVNNFKTGVISTPHQCAYARYVVMKDSSTNNSLSLEELVSNNDIVVTQGGSNIAYEPYKSNTTTFDQKDGKTIVLRSLPNGVCDTLNVETGEYIQRIKEITFDGSSDESWGLNTVWSSGDYCAFWEENTKDKLSTGYAICDKMPTKKDSELINDGVAISNGWRYMYQNMYIFIEKNKLSSTDTNGLRQYLSQNPITVQYELENSIIKTIDLSGFPFAYENGHVILSSGSIEQSLTPTVEYSLSANKTGQINSNTKRVSAHQKQLDDFEAMMLTQMVQSAYDKAILQFDYEMQMMSLGGE